MLLSLINKVNLGYSNMAKLAGDSDKIVPLQSNRKQKDEIGRMTTKT